MGPECVIHVRSCQRISNFFFKEYLQTSTNSLPKPQWMGDKQKRSSLSIRQKENERLWKSPEF